jgi:sugar phosphate isomerase/epimerase
VRFAYNSNGLKQHSVADAVRLLADLGYDAIELALQREHLHPLEASADEVGAVREMLKAGGLGVVCGAGVPHALSDERFEPSLFHPDSGGRALRRRYLQAALEVAAELGSELLVTCTGRLQPGVASAQAWAWLVEGIGEICRRAGQLGIRMAVEPEPGHFVETLDDYRRLRSEFGDPNLGLTVDVGHVYCTEAEPAHVEMARVLREERLLHVQIEDMRDRRHEHLPFGEGEIDFPPIFRALTEADYSGYVGVELSRHSHRAANLAASSLTFLRSMTAASTMS